jgi:flagellar biosynthesis anti-sigma factor FlgM
MRIDLNSVPQPSPESDRSSASSTAAHASSAAGNQAEGVDVDQAQFSGAHVQVQALAAQVLQLPEVRQERVHALRLAIQNGDYQPSPEEVAGAVFDSMMFDSMIARPAA